MSPEPKHSRTVATAVALSVFSLLQPSPGIAQASWGLEMISGMNSGAPTVIDHEAMVLEVLPETGTCFAPPVAAVRCPRVRLPDGTVQDVRIDGFDRAGPLTIEVDRLTHV